MEKEKNIEEKIDSLSAVQNSVVAVEKNCADNQKQLNLIKKKNKDNAHKGLR